MGVDNNNILPKLNLNDDEFEENNFVEDEHEHEHECDCDDDECECDEEDCECDDDECHCDDENECDCEQCYMDRKYDSFYFKYLFEQCESVDDIILELESLTELFKKYKENNCNLLAPVDNGYVFIEKYE